MDIVCISIGNELLSGEITDTNKQWIGRTLKQAGYTLAEAITVGDDRARIRATIEYCIDAGYAIIATGGLGPTSDDITARAVAQAYRLRLVLSDEALDMVRGFFRCSGKSCPPGNEKQALLPQKAQPLENTCGTAPGFYLRHNTCPAFFLPGVPQEMQTMFSRQVLPLLQSSVPPHEVPKSNTLYTFGIPEAELEQRLHQAVGDRLYHGRAVPREERLGALQEVDTESVRGILDRCWQRSNELILDPATR